MKIMEKIWNKSEIINEDKNKLTIRQKNIIKNKLSKISLIISLISFIMLVGGLFNYINKAKDIKCYYSFMSGEIKTCDLNNEQYKKIKEFYGE